MSYSVSKTRRNTIAVAAILIGLLAWASASASEGPQRPSPAEQLGAQWERLSPEQQGRLMLDYNRAKRARVVGPSGQASATGVYQPSSAHFAQIGPEGGEVFNVDSLVFSRFS